MSESDIIWMCPATLVDLPEISHIPTLSAAAALAEKLGEEGPAGDWHRLVQSLRETGKINEPLSIVELGSSVWAVADGRSRRAAAALLRQEGDKRFDRVPCRKITREEAEGLALESLHRRHVPSYTIAYMACLKHEGELTRRGKGRPSKAIASDDTVTQQTLADTCGVPRSTICACVVALRHFQTHPADRAKDEPKILAGLMDPVRVVHAASGRDATADQDRRPTSYTSWLPKLKSFTSTLRGFDQWEDSGRENAAAVLKLESAMWPESFRTMLLSALVPPPPPVPAAPAVEPEALPAIPAEGGDAQ